MEQIKKSTNLKYGASIFLGVLLISFGLGFMLINNKLITLPELHIEDILASILIAVGIALLKVPQFVRYIFNALTAILISIFILSFSPCCNFHFFQKYESHSENNKNNQYIIKKLPEQNISNLVLKAAALSIDINPIDSALLVLSQNHSIGSNCVNYDSSLSNIEINLNNIKRSRHSRNSEIQLNDSISWNINADFGASDIHADFSNIKVSSLHFNCGASNIDLELGKRQESTDIVFESGASNIEITIPKEAICEVYSNSSLSSSDFDDFQELSSGFYQSNNTMYSSNQKIKITISGAVSNFKISRQ
jgi:hypothetical protein